MRTGRANNEQVKMLFLLLFNIEYWTLWTLQKIEIKWKPGPPLMFNVQQKKYECKIIIMKWNLTHIHNTSHCTHTYDEQKAPNAQYSSLSYIILKLKIPKWLYAGLTVQCTIVRNWGDQGVHCALKNIKYKIYNGKTHIRLNTFIKINDRNVFLSASISSTPVRLTSDSYFHFLNFLPTLIYFSCSFSHIGMYTF